MERTHPAPTPSRTPADRGPQTCDGCRDHAAEQATRAAEYRAGYARLLDRAHRHLDLHLNQADEALRRARAARTAVA